MNSLEETPSSSLWRLGRDELMREFVASEAERRRVDPRHLELLREMEGRGVKVTWGYRNVASLVGAVSEHSRSEGNKLAKLVASLPHLPGVLESLAAGEINIEHVEVMADFHKSLSSAVHPEAWEAAIPTLIGLAKIWRPSRVARFADTELRLRLDPDGVLPKEKALAEPGNRMSLKQRADGWWKYEGYLEPESGSLWAAQLEPGCKPRPTTEWEGPDTRSGAERLGDSLSEWITHAATAPATEGGEPPQLVVTIDWENLRSGLGHAELGPNQQPIPVSQARRLACDAQVLRSCSVAARSRWTLASLRARSLPGSAGLWSIAINTAVFRVVTGHRQFARCTM